MNVPPKHAYTEQTFAEDYVFCVISSLTRIAINPDVTIIRVIRLPLIHGCDM